ncbi:GlxA family transcriptional regulator [Marinobacterium litorale]|uniref:GlxA family transcriptional regulator n=1 Tax=Marinobacterium litorale TaxID=404770 RepID=UPI00041D1E39|nr:GlxA family transcriptional regulator [Marinobacterium litorale]
MKKNNLSYQYQNVSGPSQLLSHASFSKEQHCETPFKVVFVLLENFSMAAFTNAVDVLTTTNLINNNELVKFTHVCLEGNHVLSDVGLEIKTRESLEEALRADLDMLVICGGYRTPLINSLTLESVLTRCARRQKWIGGIWNGIYHVANTGLLDGRTCTAHPENLALLKELFPKTDVSTKSYEIDGRFFSSSGPNSTMKVMLELVDTLFGDSLKLGVDEILACDTYTDVDDHLIKKYKHRALPASLRSALELMESNIEEPLSLEEVAAYISISRRHMERLFSRYFEISPSRFYLELRLSRGRQLLLQSDRSIAEISIACGFLSSTHFSHSFRDLFGMSPTKMRLSSIRSWLPNSNPKTSRSHRAFDQAQGEQSKALPLPERKMEPLLEGHFI